jgi:hypothetical protein
MESLTSVHFSPFFRRLKQPPLELVSGLIEETLERAFEYFAEEMMNAQDFVLPSSRHFCKAARSNIRLLRLDDDASVSFYASRNY